MDATDISRLELEANMNYWRRDFPVDSSSMQKCTREFIKLIAEGESRITFNYLWDRKLGNWVCSGVVGTDD